MRRLGIGANVHFVVKDHRGEASSRPAVVTSCPLADQKMASMTVFIEPGDTIDHEGVYIDVNTVQVADVEHSLSHGWYTWHWDNE